MNFSTEHKGKVFYFPGQDDVLEVDRAWVRLRPVSNEHVLKIAKAATSHQVELKQDSKGVDQPIHWDDTDNLLLFKDTWDFCIMEWGNICVDDKPLECNSDNKALLVGQDQVFASWCMAWRKEQEAEVDALTDMARGNELSTSEDSTPSQPATSVESSGSATE